MKMLKTLFQFAVGVIVISAFIFSVIGLVGYFKGLFIKKFGGSYITGNSITLAGSETVFASMPLIFHNGNSTTTDASNATSQLDIGGQTITQDITTGGLDQVVVSITGRGNSPTSTLSMQQTCSMDGTYYSPFKRATSTLGFVDATTTQNLLPNAVTVDLGTATTTFVYNFYTGNCEHTRLLFMGDDLSTDPTDGVKAWIRAYLIEGVTK